MLSIVALIAISMFVYVNTIYYTLALLAIVLLLLRSLASTSSIHTLTLLMLLIVYLGAIIILIGYICAISPNLIIRTNLFGFLQSLVLVLSFTLFLDFKS